MRTEVLGFVERRQNGVTEALLRDTAWSDPADALTAIHDLERSGSLMRVGDRLHRVSYVGIPFRDGGRDRGGCDCWGLFRLVYADHGIDLPIYGEIGATEMLRIAREFKHETESGEVWRRADHLPRQRLDAVVMRRASEVDGPAWHIGVMLDGKRMLHTELATDSVLVPLAHHSVASRITGFYRHRDFA